MISQSVISFFDKFSRPWSGRIAIVLMRALAEVADPNQCRRNPDAYRLCKDPPRPRRIGEMQCERNGDQRKKDRGPQRGRAPAQLREIEEPVERRHAPIKPRLPEAVGAHQREEPAMCEIE